MLPASLKRREKPFRCKFCNSSRWIRGWDDAFGVPESEDVMGAARGDFQAAPSGAVQEADSHSWDWWGLPKTPQNLLKQRGAPALWALLPHPPCRDRTWPLRLLQSPFSMWKNPQIVTIPLFLGLGTGGGLGSPQTAARGEAGETEAAAVGGEEPSGRKDLGEREPFVGLQDVPFRKSAPGSPLPFPSPSLGGSAFPSPP